MTYLRLRGYTVDRTEHWNIFARVRQDLFGFIDLLAIRPGEMLAVQTTTLAHWGGRREKILSLGAALTWLKAGGKIQIHGWRKLKGRWAVEVFYIHEKDFHE